MNYNAVIFALGLLDIQPESAAKHDCRPKDCYDLSCYGLSEGIDGPHTIYPNIPHLPSLNVSCDQETDGGGWIMYQRRVDGKVHFKRNWQEYKYGFGNNGGNTTELWLGNENVYQLVQSYGYNAAILRIEVDAFDGAHGWIEASNFELSDERDLYRIYWIRSRASTVSMRDAWNELYTHSFKTFDNIGGEKVCLDRMKGGWWYTRVGRCGPVLLNGEYLNSEVRTKTSIFVRNFKTVSLQRSRMMFRETHYVHACDNPCKNGAACEHVAKPRSHRCVCKSEFCGPECELRNPCKNGGACEYDTTTISTTCKCSAEFVGPTCEDAIGLPTTPTPLAITSPTTPPTIIVSVVGGIMLLLILCGTCITAGVIYTRRQWKKQQEEKEKEEAAEQQLKLAEAEDSESGSFRDHMLSMFGL